LIRKSASLNDLIFIRKAMDNLNNTKQLMCAWPTIDTAGHTKTYFLVKNSEGQLCSVRWEGTVMTQSFPDLEVGG
jgi:hypothetical protein